MLGWIEANPDDQKRLLKQLHDARLEAGISALIDAALARQTSRVTKRSRRRS
jgi:hypothetical protein